MMINDIIKIERGTLIQGFTVKPFNFPADQENTDLDSRARCATLNINGWSYPNPRYVCPNVNTLFYTESNRPSWVKTYSSEKIKKSAKGIVGFADMDPWDGWEGDLQKFPKDVPVGVHMGEFIVGWIGTPNSNSINLYSKTLLINGKMGYLVFETDNVHTTEAELI